MTDKELLKLIGKEYTSETELLLKYGAEIDAQGKIARVITKKDFNRVKKICKI